MNLAIVTKIPSPYQVELFDEIAKDGDTELSVIYLRRKDPDRSWSPRSLAHAALFLDEGDYRLARDAVLRSDLAVFSWYRDSKVSDLLAARASEGGPWCFWGERPGFKHPGLLGRTYRRARLWRLWLDDRVPIWGIGHWAIDAYKREFGSRRQFFHVPYVSNLEPFFGLSDRVRSAQRTVLFSGSLIPRKGIEDLCKAFRRLATRRPGIRLQVLGSGPLEGALKREFLACPQIEFLGFRDWDGLASAYANADILCAPSHYDGWGLIVPEAMASGIPVVASNTMGSALEMVVEGETGWFVSPGDIDALERVLESAMDSSEMTLNRMAHACRDVAGRYDVRPGARNLLASAEKSVSRSDAKEVRKVL
jgi:glycosyltransferase involved in cell wall biosynthesis